MKYKNAISMTVTGLALSLLTATPVLAAERMTINTHVADVTSQLQRVGRLPGSQHMQLAIGLPLRNKEAMTNLFRELYRPGSPSFHHYLRPDQFAEKFGPTEQDYQRVKDYAKANRLEVVGTYDNRALLDVAGTVADIEGMFHVQLGDYQHPTENRQFFAPDVEPSVDAGLPISYVVGLDNYVIPHPSISKLLPTSHHNRPNVFNGSGSNNYYLGKDFRNAYVPGVSLKGAGQTVGLFELVGYTASDVAKYESLAGISSVSLTNIVCPEATDLPSPTDNDENHEVAVDIDMVVAMAPEAQVLVVIGYTGVDAMNQLASTNNGAPLANQVSSSWAASGQSNCEPALIQMALQGQSFFLYSGDHGAPSNGLRTGTGTDDFNYATVVGGTELSMTNYGVGWQSETVWDYQWANGASSGFIDTELPIPDYQLGVNTSANGGSTAYRNIPDVAMCADYIEEVYTETFTNGTPTQTGQVIGIGGTSCATPLWAAFTALVNEQAAAQGAPPVGFLNPALYGIAQGPFYTNCFHDIVSGNNVSTNSDNLYYAGPGYDNCTGLGSPNGQAMINALVGYSGPVFVNFNYTGALSTQNGAYYTPFKTLAQGINAVSSYGTIFIENAGSSTETPTIIKPLTILASDGTDTIGN